MNARQRAIRSNAIRSSMIELARNSNFGHFIEIVREQRDAAIDDLCSDRVANERLTMVAIGEIRVYKSIIAAYEEVLDQPLPEDPPQ